MTTPREVVARRRQDREALLDVARGFARQLPSELDVRAVVVFGSVARGDFGDASDIDVLVVCTNLPPGPIERLRRLGDAHPRIEPVAWTPDEWQRQHNRGNPIAVDAVESGVWIVGSVAAIGRRA